MSVYDDIAARIADDRARAKERSNDETLEGARAEIIDEILLAAEHWQLKAEDWGPEEAYVHNRNRVCQQILEVLHEHLWKRA